jgi:plastocyanin
MQRLKMKQFPNFKLSSAVLIASASIMILVGTVSQARHENGPVKPVAASADSPAQVVIDNFVYSPVPLTVKVGTQVTWINHDDIPHTVDSTQGKFKSAALDTNDKFEFKFTEPGEYPFYCRVHPKMTGKIIVQP